MVNDYKIVVAGTGYVGLVTGVCLTELGHRVTCVDVVKEKIDLMRSGISPIYEPGLSELMTKNGALLTYTTDYKEAYKDADVIFIAVGTPEQEDGSANLNYVKAVSKQIAETIAKDCVIVVKSTVPIGTNDEVERFIREHLVNDVKVSIASNPEFLSQGSAVKDTLHAKRIVIGVEDKWAEEVLVSVYKGFDQPFVITNRRSAEMIKYAANDFLALKISYINEIANMCELVGANIEDVTKGMSYDTRIGKEFLKAGIGFGGACFPKDTKALYNQASSEFGYEMQTIKAAIDVNARQKTKLFFEAKKRLGVFDNLTVAILGLTFKPYTDDLREAPSVDNINMLLKNGAKIKAYDPVGIENAKKIFEDTIEYTDDITDAIKQADVAFIMTEWKEIVNFNVDDYVKLMKTPLIFDGRNCYDIETMKAKGIEYISVGRR
ncbi:MAG: UDP-glucose/GDP-mannose dehydrogenase family protein [Erysipelotrichaceae bacterium]|nr:UDP-glucose/GDP-mannose dehydrogenase family protein [Erysipelotrichaceae bacterium]MDD3924262.1 UDP-glucose/GDP-mannose dehydrogenase family protein [Erysipelotrichaceae bacterium]